MLHVSIVDFMMNNIVFFVDLELSFLCSHHLIIARNFTELMFWRITLFFFCCVCYEQFGANYKLFCKSMRNVNGSYFESCDSIDQWFYDNLVGFHFSCVSGKKNQTKVHQPWSETDHSARALISYYTQTNDGYCRPANFHLQDFPAFQNNGGNF